MTNASNDENIIALEGRWGFAGVGRYWRLLELIAQQMDQGDRCYLTCRPGFWASQLGFRSAINARSFLEWLAIDRGMITVTFGNEWTVTCLKLLKIRARKPPMASKPCITDIDIDIDIDKEKEKKNKYAPYVLLLDSEYFKLTEKYGDDIAKKCVEKLNNYKGSTGKKYKSDYLTILNWVVGEVLKDNKLIKNDVFAKYGVK